MRRLIRFLPFLALILLIHPFPTHAAEFRSGSDNVTVTNPIQRDTFAASKVLSIKAPITGEAFFAGNTVTIDQPISRSAYIVGSSITINKGVGYNLFAAGNSITLDGTYGNDVYLAGSTVTLSKDTVITGDLWVEGATVVLHGTITGSVHIDSTTLSSDAVIGGSLSGPIVDTTFTGGSIGGTFHYTSDTDATGLDKVTIKGTVTRDTPTAPTAWEVIKALLTALVGALLLGSLLAYRFPSSVTRVLDRVQSNYTRNLFFGLAWLILIPVVIVALAITIIGWKVAIFIGLLYCLSLLLAGIFASFVIGRYLYTRFFPSRRENIWDYLIAGLLITYLLSAISFLGAIVGVAVFAFAFLPSLGALGSRLIERE